MTTMTKEEELKQHAIEFAGWLIVQGYTHYGKNQYIRTIQYHHGPTSVGYGTVVESEDVLYLQFLDNKLSEVEIFRKALLQKIKERHKDNNSSFSCMDSPSDIYNRALTYVINIIQSFNIPTETAEELTENNSL
jgi:hypothetical protein